MIITSVLFNLLKKAPHILCPLYMACFLTIALQ
jgi:hypothetical protein